MEIKSVGVIQRNKLPVQFCSYISSASSLSATPAHLSCVCVCVCVYTLLYAYEQNAYRLFHKCMRLTSLILAPNREVFWLKVSDTVCLAYEGRATI